MLQPAKAYSLSKSAHVALVVTVDESIREEDGSDDEEKDEDKKDNVCQLSKPMDGVSAQRQVLRALALEV